MNAVELYLERRFRPIVLLLAASYCAIQLVYIAHLPLVMDEFDGAYEAFRLRSSLPYRDFLPYKTTLGYYIQTAGSFGWPSVWSRIMAIKFEMAAINTVMLAAAALFLSRSIRKPAVVAALLPLIACSAFLERSSELRVDMLTAWAGMWSLLFLLRRRYLLAGAVAGLSFLVSQKGAFYLLAGSVALLGEFVWTAERRENVVRHGLQFVASATAVIGAYVAVWSAFASLHTLVSVTFLGGAKAALVSGYDIRHRFWAQFLRRDFMFCLLTAIALWRTASIRTIAICAYAIAVFAQALLYPQPWPYFFVLILPTAMVLQAVAFDTTRWKPAIAAVALVLAVLYPLHRVFLVLRRSHDYQRYNVELASALMASGDRYLAGDDIIHDHEQHPTPLARLDASVINHLRTMTAAQLVPIQEALEQDPPRLVINTYRISGLPRVLSSSIEQNYARISASVFLYAPMANGGEIHLAFPGRYAIDQKTPGDVEIDGTRYRTGTRVELALGAHRVIAAQPVRLRLMPAALEDDLDPRFVEEQEFYPHVYDY